ncbi:MAG TPA: hypothetical protein VI758_05705 [Bacteroidota bacterium]
MKASVVSKYFGYGVSFVSLCVGVIFLFGLFIHPGVPTQFRIMCGVVFLLLGVYRFVATRYRTREEERIAQ